MFEQAFKNIDDVLWKEAGCTTELDYTEQTSWLLFLKYLDGLEQDKADEAALDGKKYDYILDKPYRWDTWAAPKGKDGKLDHNKALTGDDLRDFVNQKLFPYLNGFTQKATGPNTIEYKIGQIFGEIKNKISSGYNLREIIDHIDELRFRSQTEKHELSHLYEAKIKNMGNAGRNGGEYYTPRPLIRAIIQVVKPKIGERIYDGAVGSAGFLCESFEYLKAKGGLTTKNLDTLQSRTFYGKEKKSLAYVIGIMNMILHGIDAPNIIHTNTLSENLADIQEKDRFDVVLANPPFGGKERKEVQQNFPIRTGESAFLFLQHFIKILKAGGRGGVVIKNTFLSNTDNASVMRPINSMIEFKQIIGRGTRLYDGKDYFTIYDFVKAHHHFSDPEWDGEPIEPEPSEPCRKCGCRPCQCEQLPPQACAQCNKRPCECPKEPCPVCGKLRCVCKKKTRTKVKLADGKERNIQHMMATTFWHPDGTPMSAQQFMEMLFGKLPEFFKDETELRSLWSAPETRKKLLQGLAEKGFGGEQLVEMQKIIDAEKSDLFDVLAHVAYALPPVTREERAARAKVVISTHFNSKQRVFLDFVLSHYVRVGVEELDQEKLTPLLRLKYHNSIADALADLGRAEEIGWLFSGFQKYLYQQQAAA